MTIVVIVIVIVIAVVSAVVIAGILIYPVCSVSWELEEENAATRVTFTWSMRGSMPFFLRSALTVPFKGNIEAMVTAMRDAFPKLAAHVERSGGKLTSGRFAAYHKANIKTMHFECDMAVPVGDDLPDGEFVPISLGGGRCFKVSVQGSYDFLELAWYSAMSYLRILMLKTDESRPSLEVYENDPASVQHTNELRTTLYIPIR